MGQIYSKPPQIAQWLLSHTLKEEDRDILLGDFEEFFMEIKKKTGFLKATIWYWKQVFKSIPLFLSNYIYWSTTMFKNYLKIAVRNMLKNKVYSFIIIIGFSIGLACLFLIAMWVQNEFSYDNFFTNADLVYKVDGYGFFNTKDLKIGSQTNYTGPMLERDLPEIEKYLRLYRPFKSSIVRRGKDKHFREDNIIFADKSFFEFFDFPLKLGDRKSALNDPLAVVISNVVKNKYFLDENPVGKILEINGKIYKVTGVVDINSINSHIDFDFLLKLPAFSFKMGESQNLNLAYFTYILLKEGTNVDFLQKKVSKLVNKYIKPITGAIGMKNYRYDIFLCPLKDVYLHSYINTNFFKNFRKGSITNIYIMMAFSFIILFIVSFNYMNLTLARSLVRTTEIGLRKIVGAKKSQIRRQILGETMIQAAIALAVAILITVIIFPIFSHFTGRNLNFKNISNIFIAVMILIMGVFVFLSGIYPAAFLARINPAELIRNKLLSGSTKSLSRRIIVITQFTLSITLIISTFFIAKQINFMKNKDLGFPKKNKIVLNLANSEYEKKHPILKTALERTPGVEAVSVSSTIPGEFAGQNAFNIEGDKSIRFLWMYFVDYDFIPAYGFKLLKGRNFSKDIITDKNAAAIINESAVKNLGLKNAIGAIIEDQEDKKTYKVIGIIKDFHNESLHGEIKPLIIRSIYSVKQKKYMKAKFMTILINNENIFEMVSAIKEKYTRIVPNQLFEYFFIDNLYDSFYKEEARFNKIFIYSSSLAIFLSCLGLLGLTNFIIQRKIREIGIRKVLGASVSKIFLLLSKEFLSWVLFANVIAWPTAYFALNEWLQNFAYRIPIDIWTFIISGLLTLMIALLTVSFQSIKAATTNPVDTLKYE